jgi:hypothetical protein
MIFPRLRSDRSGASSQSVSFVAVPPRWSGVFTMCDDQAIFVIKNQIKNGFTPSHESTSIFLMKEFHAVEILFHFVNAHGQSGRRGRRDHAATRAHGERVVGASSRAR